MVTGLTQTLGVVIANIEDEFFSRIVRGIADGARSAGFDVMLMNSDEDVEEEGRAVRALMEKQVDGMIVAPASTQIPEHMMEVHESGMPIVLLDRSLDGLDADAVMIDGVEAAESAVRYLIGLGHRRIGIVTDAPPRGELPGMEQGSRGGIRTGATRLAGYERALERAGIRVDDELIGWAAPTVQGAREQIHALLDRSTPSAIFAIDNTMTLGVLEGMQERKVAIPGDISLFGFDDLEWMKVACPPLSVVSQPMYEMGLTAARSLLARIHGLDEPARSHILPTTLVHRASTARPPSGA
jgi:LacI family transcriptional regulator